MRYLLATLTVATTGFAQQALATPACTYPFVEMGPIVAPAVDATDVPTNVAPLINLIYTSEPPALTAGAAGVEVTETTINYVDGFGTEQVVLLRPRSPLPQATLVTMTLAGGRLQTFTTGDGPDMEAPSAPELGGFTEFSDGACEPFVAIELTGDGSEAYFIAALDEEPSLDEGAEINGITSGPRDDTIIVGGPASAKGTVFVAAVDLAGNVGPPSSIEVTFPAQPETGCGHNGPSQIDGPRPRAAALLVLLGFLLRRRSRAADSTKP